MNNGHTQPFDWALERLGREFGADRVSVKVAEDGRELTVAIAPEEGDQRPYTVVLNDPILGDVNRVADPPAFLDAEVGFARSWFAGESKRFRTYG